jgi:hypothetical protein
MTSFIIYNITNMNNFEFLSTDILYVKINKDKVKKV